jgi:hypothetical protein
MQWMEFHDQPWFPRSFRDGVTDALQFIMNLGGVYDPIVPRLNSAMEFAGTHRIVDLCSGAGGPWLRIQPILEQKKHQPVDIYLTDIYPNVAMFEEVRKASHGKINYSPDSVDAARLPVQLKGFRTIFSSYHHFDPKEATAILRDAVANGQGVGVFEVAKCHPVTIFLVILMPLVSLFVTPFIRPFRFSRLFWTYIVPVIPFVLYYDGVISCLRSYSLTTLSALTRDLSAQNYQWQIGEDNRTLHVLPITYLVGFPCLQTTKTALSPVHF